MSHRELARPPAFGRTRSDQLALEFARPRRVFETRALAVYRGRLPVRIANAIAAFPDFHGELLEFAAGGDACVELMVANPALVALLLTAWDFQGVSYVGTLDRARQLVLGGLRQRELLQQVGIPAGSALPRLLRKIPAWSLDLMTSAALADAVQKPDLVRLSHLPIVTGPVLQLASKPMLAWVTDRFLRELLDLSLTESRHLACWESPSQRAVDELTAFAELWNAHGPDVPLRIDSIAGLGRQLGTFYAALHRAELGERAGEALPPPPLPGNDDIEPITTIGALVDEAERQRHCVGTYVMSIQNGRRAIYRVLRPERATLSLHCHNGRWAIEELRAKANARVRPETEAAVRAWFSAALPPGTRAALPPGN